jgi:WD40 repeat protein/LysM repeat protein
MPSENNPCISIYVHDRLTGDMENIANPQEDSIHLYPTISDDGRWISFMEVHFDCVNTNGFCVDLNLYDRERGWTSEVTRNLNPRDDIPWELDTILETTASNTTGVEFSPDGEAIALFGTGRYVVIIDAVYGEELVTLQGDSRAAILKLSFSPDGRYVAGGASDGSVNIWRSSDGTLAYILDEHPGRIVEIQYSADGEYLYVTTPRAVGIWYRTERKYTRVNYLEYSDVTIKDVGISPSNELMVMVPSQDPSIWIQRLPRGDVIHRLTGYGSMISSASFSPDGKYLIVQFTDGLMQVWQLEVDALGSIIPTLVNEGNSAVPFGKIVLSPEGAFVATGTLFDGVHLWEITNGRSWTIPGSNNVRFISGVVFSPNGYKLAASSLGGGVYLWSKTSAPDDSKMFAITFTDEFIQIPNRRRPIQDAVAHLDLDRIDIEGLTLYEADDQVPFDLFAPFRLPSTVMFVESSIMQDGGVLVQYRVDDRLSGQPIADLYFRQRLITGAIQPIRIGESAFVENIQFYGRSAEYVRGDWLSIPAQEAISSIAQDIQNIHWTWSSASDVQQMRWQHSTQLFSLSYIPRSNGESPNQQSTTDTSVGLQQQVHLTKYDLIAIASGISNLNRSAAPDRILTNYTVKPGDTCTSIAFQYDTTVSTLTRMNRLSDNCEVIVEGQTLLVPLPNERLPLTEVDLNCDGNFERVRLVPTPLYVDSDISYGIILEALSDIGLYEKRWQYTVAEVNAEYIARPQLLPTLGCQQLLALNVMGLTEENDSGLRVFEWDAESMKLIFTAEGWLQSVTPFESGVSISTLALEYLPGTSTCNRITVIYTWDGIVFNETTRYVEEGGSCGLR